MNTRIARIAMAFAAVTVLAIAPVQAVEAKGLIGGAVKWVGDRTGIKPVSKLGHELDNASRDIKKAVPIYGFVEEVSSRIVRETGKFIAKHPAETIALAIVIATAGVACADGCTVLLSMYWVV